MDIGVSPGGMQCSLVTEKTHGEKTREGTVWHRLETFPTICKALRLDSGGRHWPEARNKQKWIPELVV